MKLRALTNGSVSGTDTLTITSYILGAVLITTDNSNQATVIVRRESSSGKQIFKIATATTIWIAGPIDMEGTDQAHISVTGTGAAAQFYEWLE